MERTRAEVFREMLQLLYVADDMHYFPMDRVLRESSGRAIEDDLRRIADEIRAMKG